jgi:hypothetical protein
MPPHRHEALVFASQEALLRRVCRGCAAGSMPVMSSCPPATPGEQRRAGRAPSAPTPPSTRYLSSGSTARLSTPWSSTTTISLATMRCADRAPDSTLAADLDAVVVAVRVEREAELDTVRAP